MTDDPAEPGYIAALTDESLLHSYQGADGEDAEAEALLREIERRGLDI